MSNAVQVRVLHVKLVAAECRCSISHVCNVCIPCIFKTILTIIGESFNKPNDGFPTIF